MPFNAGNSDCSTGASGRILGYWVGDSRSGLSSAAQQATSSARDMLRAPSWAIARGVAEELSAPDVYARYNANASQSFGANSYNLCAFSQQTEDNRSACTVVPYWKFTCPASGLYQVAASVLLLNAQSGSFFFDALVGGNTQFRQAYLSYAGNYMSTMVSGTLRIAQGQVLTFALSNNTGSASSCSSSYWDTWVSVARTGN